MDIYIKNNLVTSIYPLDISQVATIQLQGPVRRLPPVKQGYYHFQATYIIIHYKYHVLGIM